MTLGDADGHDCCTAEVFDFFASHPQAAAAVGAALATTGEVIKEGALTAVGIVASPVVIIGSMLATPIQTATANKDELHLPAPGTQTKADNPARPGTLGKPDHQATVEEERQRLNGKKEVTIPTPEGSKGSRRADAVGTNPETGATEIVQVYRPTKGGNIPKREVDAANDIEKATGIKPTMVPVRPIRGAEDRIPE